MKIFYHNDADGKCAANIVYSKYKQSHDVELFAITHGMDFPIDMIKEDELVFIVDYSIEPDEMRELLSIASVVWIDHHISAIEKYDSENMNIDGIRNIEYSGCELTWMHIYPFVPIPKSVKLVGDRDLWKFNFGESKAYHTAWMAAGEPGPKSDWWDKQNSNDIEGIIEDGSLLLEADKNRNKSMCDKWSYETMFEGHKILVANTNVFTSEFFGDRINDYPFVAVYCHEGDHWKVSMYSISIDIVDIAIKNGGGGHKRACGFVTKELPFKLKTQDPAHL